MANSKLKLTYFDFYGLGEGLRLILKYAGKDFEDVRITGEQWPGLKETFKLHQVPELEVDGKLMCQSLAIRGFLAREFGLYGQTTMDAVIIDTVVGTTLDMFKFHASWIYMPDGPDKEQKKAAAPAAVAKFLDYLESLLAQNGTGYFVGESLTLGDLVMFDALTGYTRQSIGSIDKYPWISKNKANVLKNANIAEYVAKRKVFDF